MGILKFIFIAIVLIFPLGEIGRFQFTNGIALSINDIGVAILVTCWLIIHLLKRKKIATGLLTKNILIFVSVGFLSLIINIRFLDQKELMVSSLYLLRWVVYAGVYFVVLEFDRNFKKKSLFLITAVGFLIVVIGYLQYFLYPNLRNLYYAGWDEHLYRMFSTFLDPNFAATFFVLFFLFVTGLLFDDSKNRKIRKTLIMGTIGILTLGAIFLTYSRSGLLMLFFSVLMFLIMNKLKRWIIAVLLLLIVLIVLSPKAFQTEGTNLLRIASSQERIQSAQHALTIFKDNFLFGVGFNAYRYAQIRYGYLKGENSLFSHAGSGTDNSFLFVMVTSGIVGLVSYLFLWYKALKIYSAKPKIVSKIILFSSFFGLFINALFINSLFYPFIMEWVWIFIGINESVKESR